MGVGVVPTEALPTDSAGVEFEPPGWRERGEAEQREVAAQEAREAGAGDPATGLCDTTNVTVAVCMAAAAGVGVGVGGSDRSGGGGGEGSDRDGQGNGGGGTGGSRSAGAVREAAAAAAGGCVVSWLQRPVCSERDIWELFRLPYREPHQRNA